MSNLANKSYGHSIERLGSDSYRISWIIDRKHSGKRGRTMSSVERWTDEAGAKRFASKWGCALR